MGFKNFDKADDEKVENVEKTDNKSEGEKKNIGDKIKDFFAGKGKEGKEESKEGKEEKNENKEKNEEDKKDRPSWELTPEQKKAVNDYNKEMADKLKNKQDAGNNNSDDPDKGQKEIGLKPKMENKEEQKNKDDGWDR